MTKLTGVWIGGVKQKVLKKRKRGRPAKNTVVWDGDRLLIPRQKIKELLFPSYK